jgi:chemotaxis protein methyltransferase CheR
MACSDTDYAYLREIVLSESANLIDPSRNALFDTRLTPLARLSGASNLKDFVEILRGELPVHLHRAVAEAMTINETSFFRDVRPFEALHTTILPRLIRAREAKKKLFVWSAASSTGQEAYSIAMLLRDRFPELADWDVKIIGTDISRQVVDYAKQGRYRRLEVNRGLPARMLLRYFTRDGEEWVVNPEIRAMCDFRYANLCTPLPPLPVFDLVLLRNVLLYFPQHDRNVVLSQTHRHISPDGYLLLGNSEQAEDSSDLFRLEFAEGSYFYRASGKL